MNQQNHNATHRPPQTKKVCCLLRSDPLPCPHCHSECDPDCPYEPACDRQITADFDESVAVSLGNGCYLVRPTPLH